MSLCATEDCGHDISIHEGEDMACSEPCCPCASFTSLPCPCCAREDEPLDQGDDDADQGGG